MIVNRPGNQQSPPNIKKEMILPEPGICGKSKETLFVDGVNNRIVGGYTAEINGTNCLKFVKLFFKIASCYE